MENIKNIEEQADTLIHCWLQADSGLKLKSAITCEDIDFEKFSIDGLINSLFEFGAGDFQQDVVDLAIEKLSHTYENFLAL